MKMLPYLSSQTSSSTSSQKQMPKRTSCLTRMMNLSSLAPRAVDSNWMTLVAQPVSNPFNKLWSLLWSQIGRFPVVSEQCLCQLHIVGAALVRVLIEAGELEDPVQDAQDLDYFPPEVEERLSVEPEEECSDDGEAEMNRATA